MHHLSYGLVTMNGINEGNLIVFHTELTYALVGYGIRFAPPEITNIAARFRTDIHVNAITFYYQNPCFYNPELSNAIEVKVGGCKALLHHTGNGILTGARSRGELEHAWDELLCMIAWS